MKRSSITLATFALAATVALTGCDGESTADSTTAPSAAGTPTASASQTPPATQSSTGAPSTTSSATESTDPSGTSTSSTALGTTASPTAATSGATQAAPTSAPIGAGNDGITRTQIRSISPTAGGVYAPGWTTTDRTSEGSGMCYPSEASPVAQDSGIFGCGANASGYDACWQVAADTAACAASPYRKHVDLLDFTGTVTAKRPSTPVPWGVVLADGTTCQPSFGGGGSVRPDGYISRYYCDNHRELVAPDASENVQAWFTRGTVWTAQVVTGPGLEAPRSTARIKAVSFAVKIS